jgi:DNA uptake protein ComE-like DNA-binding protein
MNYDELKRFTVEITDIIKKERKFIFGIFGIAFLMQGIYYGYDFYKNREVISFETITPETAPYSDASSEHNSYVNYENSASPQAMPQKLFPFNPNTIEKEGLMALGFSEKIANIFLNYRNKGGQFRSKNDVKKIYGVSDRLYQRIEPFIQIETNHNAFQKPNEENRNSFQSKEPTSIDINKAQAEDFEKLYGIGKGYANRIVTLRTKLGAFLRIEQLNDKYTALPDTVFQKIAPKLQITNGKIKKININTAAESEIRTHPYITKWQADDILKNRPIYGENDLLDLYTFKKETYRKGMPYFEY